MNKKAYWGLGILISIIFTIIGFALIRQSQEIKQLRQEAANSLKQIETNTAKPVIVEQEDNRPPPPGKSFEGGGHWHGDEWHDAPHTADPEVVMEDGFSFSDTIPLDVTNLSQEELVGYYVKLHKEKYPDCTQDAATLSDAKRRVQWLVAYKIHAEKERQLDIQSKAIDAEIKEIVGDSIEDYHKRINSLSDTEKKSLEKRVKALYQQMLSLDTKYETLSQEKPKYPEGLHTH
ncbi:MAG: hypothetical protein OXI43_13460 [Candidatus Poribacteria bacterium]|nr:hypothetical protein [Candidatus Poribacteria bacterium]